MSHGISVILITKNCARPLQECLNSVVEDFIKPELGDEIVVVDTGSTDDGATVAVAKQCDAKVFEHPELCESGMLDLVKQYLPDYYEKCAEDPQFSNGFLSSFAKARQLATDYAKNELVFWIDSDDVLQGGAKLRALALEFFKKPENTALFLPYDYSFDTDGACNTVLWRERILRKSLYYWKGNCHESMIPKNHQPQVVQKVADPEIRIAHKNGRHHIYSDVRNYAILRREYDSPEWKDPRTEFYLGNASRGLRRWLEAIQWYAKVLERSGSRDDRLSAALNIGYCYTMFGRPWKAIDWFMQAIKIHTNEPRAYFGIARCFFELKKFQECITWTQLGRAIVPPNHLTSVDPQGFDYYPTVFLIMALKELGQGQAALAECERLQALRPNFLPAKQLCDMVLEWAKKEQASQALKATLSMSFSNQAAKEIITRLKPEVRKHLREFQVETAATKPKKSITFFCGRTLEPWDPTSENDGVGGSEKMVIALARRFAQRGWRVDVYGAPKDENAYKTFDKVAYRPIESFNPDLERDILILWRSPALLDFNFRAHKIYLDMHDVANDADFTPARMARCSGVFWKSKFHRSTAPSCPEEKCIYTRNGIDLSHFPEGGSPVINGDGSTPALYVPRNYKKIIWSSSGDRGLRGALLAWSRLYNEFPDAEFHTFYGFTPLYVKRAAEVEYQHFWDCGGDRSMLDYAEECYSLMDRLNVRHHGRIGHKQLAAELSTAGIWLYPTKFPEISCLSAMEAQAAGAFPICSNIGALAETVKYGCIVNPDNPDEIVNAIRGAFQKGKDLDTYRTEMIQWARQEFDIDSLADSWLREFELPVGVDRKSIEGAVALSA